MAFLLAAVFAVTTFPIHAAAPESPKAKPALKVKDFALKDLQGQPHSAKEWQKSKAVVLIFLGTECPVSNGYAPTLVRLVKEYAPKGVVFHGVYPDPDVNAEAALKHSTEFQLATVGQEMSLLLDPHQTLPPQTGVTRVPEAVVLSATGAVLYHGRIDDRHSLDGRRREEPRTKDLANAIEAVLAGKVPEPAETKVFGCPLPPPAK